MNNVVSMSGYLERELLRLNEELQKQILLWVECTINANRQFDMSLMHKAQEHADKAYETSKEITRLETLLHPRKVKSIA